MSLAFDSGVDRLAHTPWTERIEDGVLADIAQRMTLISTIDIHSFGTDTSQLCTAMDNLRRFVDHGGTVQYGTDLGNGNQPLGVNPREVAALLAAGLTPNNVLAAMTDLNSRIPPCWVPGGLDPNPLRFARSLSLAQVVDSII